MSFVTFRNHAPAVIEIFQPTPAALVSSQWPEL